jgi:hypothetical protein
VNKRVIDMTAEDLDERDERLFARVVEALQADGPRLLDRDGLATALGVSTKTLDRLRRAGLPELRIGDSPRFDYGEVIGWLRTRREPGLRLVRGPRG